MNTIDKPTTLDLVYAQWWREALAYAFDTKKLSQTKIAEMMGISRPSLSKAKNGPGGPRGRKITAREVAELSRISGYPQPTQLPVANEEVMTDLVGLKMAVAAGIWREESKAVYSGTINVRELHEPAFDGLKQYGRLIEDFHADLYAPKGFYVICVDYSDARLTLNVGQIVIVERFQNADHTPLVEVTVREVTRRDGKWYLDPLCSDPDALKPIEYDGDTDTLRISDLVIGAWRPRQRV